MRRQATILLTVTGLILGMAIVPSSRAWADAGAATLKPVTLSATPAGAQVILRVGGAYSYKTVQASANTLFVDLAGAKVDVVCPGPLRVGQTGHPASGQTLGVESPPPATASTGYTGSRGRSIVASFVTSSAAGTATVTFTQYGTQPIPTTFLLPCYGSGVVVFAPQPTSHSARSARVAVTYSPTCSNPCPVDVQRRDATTTPTAKATDGTITGQLGFEGGPAPGGFHATAGLVQVAGSKTVELVKVPTSGNFTVHVQPGRYSLTGCGGAKDDQCGSPQNVTVTAGAVKHVQVVWAFVP